MMAGNEVHPRTPGHGPGRRGRSAAPPRALLLSLLITSGCATRPPAADVPATERAAARRHRDLPADPTATLIPERISARLWLVVLPLHAPLESAWACVGREGVAPEVAILWQANGIRVGTLDRSRVAEFNERLGPAIATRAIILYGDHHFTPQHVAPRLPPSTTLQLVASHGAAPRPRSLAGGRLQLIARVFPGPDHGARFEVCPHHHVRKPRLRPRSPLDTALDGTIFESLTLSCRLTVDRLLVLGLERPATAPEDVPDIDAGDGAANASPEQSSDAQTTDTGTDGQTTDTGTDAQSTDTGTDARTTDTGTDTQSTDAEPMIPDIAPHLGRFLFTASRLNRPVQLLLVVELPDTP